MGDLEARPNPACTCIWADGFRISAKASCPLHSSRTKSTTGFLPKDTILVEPVAAPPLSEAVDVLAEVIWTASRADESTISVIGAQHVARAVVAAGYRLVPEDDKDTVQVSQEDVLRVLEETRQKFEAAGSNSYWNRGAAHGLRLAESEIAKMSGANTVTTSFPAYPCGECGSSRHTDEAHL